MARPSQQAATPTTRRTRPVKQPPPRAKPAKSPKAPPKPPKASPLEQLALFMLEAEGLPAPITEHRFAAPRRWRFDFAWPAQHLALEIEGGSWVGGRHVRPAGFAKDCEKYAHAVLLGWRVIRVTSDQLKDGQAMRWVRAALEG
jgi:very-short-patch-repair endonuclease